MTIRDNLSAVQRNIDEAARRAGRDPRDVTLIAVTKTVDAERTDEIIALGVQHIGESRIQDAKLKYPLIVSGVRWHLIGHLQTNKAKDAVRMFDVIHSVDSAKVAAAISQEAVKAEKTVDVLVEVNISGETSKYGLPAAELEGVLRVIAGLPGIRVVGLMTMAPLSDNPEDARHCFRKLRELKDRMNEAKINNINLKHLSMGMSQDYVVAVEEGATLVRVGTALFA